MFDVQQALMEIRISSMNLDNLSINALEQLHISIDRDSDDSSYPINQIRQGGRQPYADKQKAKHTFYKKNAMRWLRLE